jgi:hypothetical protein
MEERSAEKSSSDRPSPPHLSRKGLHRLETAAPSLLHTHCGHARPQPCSSRPCSSVQWRRQAVSATESTRYLRAVKMRKKKSIPGEQTPASKYERPGQAIEIRRTGGHGHELVIFPIIPSFSSLRVARKKWQAQSRKRFQTLL